MKTKRLTITVLFLLTIILAISLLGGCKFITEHDKRQVLDAYTSENSKAKYYTFKAEVKSERDAGSPEYENEKYFKFNVDYDYFQQHYGDDDYTYLDGIKRWEARYSSFNDYEFEIIPSSFRLLKENGGYDLLQKGTTVIISANSYEGWARWKYPILSLEIDGITYLDFDTGLENYLNYVKAGFKDTN